MVVQTDSRARPPQPQDGARVPRVERRSLDHRRTSSAGRRSTAPRPERYGPPAPPAAAGERDHAQAGHHHAGDGQTAATVAQPVKVDNEIYVRDYSKCILCYKCVEGCGTDWQNTFAIAVAGRGFDARIATEFADAAARLGVRLLRQLHRRLPDRRADVQERVRHARGRLRGTRTPQTVTETICSYCGVGCSLELHVQDNEIVKVTSPLDHGVTHGNLCIKGRFGFQYVQNRADGVGVSEAIDRR